MKILLKTHLIIFLLLPTLVLSQENSNELPEGLKNKILLGYQFDRVNEGDTLGFKNKDSNWSQTKMNFENIFSRRPKLDKVKEPTKADSLVIPTWISKKQYVTDNVDAIKYEPSLLIGGLVKVFPDGTFEVYTVTWNVRKPNYPMEVSQIEKPTSFYEQTFDSKTRFNSDFLIGGLSIGAEEIVKTTYTETSYLNLKDYDIQKIESLRDYIKSISGANLQDWAIIKGIVILDCTNSKSKKMEADANANASWISANGSFYQQSGSTNNFRLISIDLENLFLLQ